MKLQLLIIISLAFNLFACDTKQNLPTPVTAPSGTFTGKFTKLQISSKTKLVDTVTANIQLNMELATGFKLTGDTSKFISESYGSYIVSSTTYIKFNNTSMLPSSSKVHLSGIYEYNYDGTILQLQAYRPLDTVSYQLTLKKKSVNNIH